MSTPCPTPCTHTDAEHDAFDRGVAAGNAGLELDQNPYTWSNLIEAWRAGQSVGFLDYREQLEEEGEQP